MPSSYLKRPCVLLRRSRKKKKNLPGGWWVRSSRVRPGRRPNQGRMRIRHRKQQTIWILKEGQPSALSISIGSTDGTMTEVTAGEVKPGMRLVLDQVKGSK